MAVAAERNVRLVGAIGLRRRFAPSLTAQAWGYWAVVVAGASAAFVDAVVEIDQADWARLGLLGGLAATAQLTSFKLTRLRVFHPSLLFVVAGVLLLPPELLVLLCVLHCVPDWVKQRYTWYVQTFNIANYVVSGLAAWAALEAVGGFVGSGDHRAAAGAVAAVVFVLVNRLLLVPMLWLGRSLSPRESGLFSPTDVAFEFVLALMGLTLAVLWGHGAWLAVASLSPLFLIHLTQRTTLRLERASEMIGRQNDSLEAAHRLVVERSTAALEALSATVDARDKYTAGHSKRVRAIAVVLAAELGLEDHELETVSQAALLHDIGKIGVPDSVLLKQGPLDQNEWLVMRSHPEEGARIIERLGYLAGVVPAIRHHHERPDGRGYPDGLIGDEVPLAARVIHVADAIDAMTTERVYRGALSFDEAIAEVRRGRGTDFCRVCVDALERALESGSLAGVASTEDVAA